jgi:hypothetical protein
MPFIVILHVRDDARNDLYTRSEKQQARNCGVLNLSQYFRHKTGWRKRGKIKKQAIRKCRFVVAPRTKVVGVELQQNTNRNMQSIFGKEKEMTK